VSATGAERLVLLPGMEGTPRVFDPLCAALSPRPCTALALPLPRRGTRCTIDGLAAEVLDQLGSGPVHLFGASIGGLVARRLAGRVPRRIRSLTTLGTLPDVRHRPGWLPLVAASLAATPPPVRQRLWRRHLGSLLQTEGLAPDAVSTLLDSLPPDRAWPAWLDAVCSWRPDGPPVVPALWLRGVDEREAPWSLAQARRDLHGVAVDAVPGGHRAMLTHPAELAARLEAQLRAVEDPASP